jgi:hypothetical protein
VRRRDYHIPYQRDEQQRIVEPERRHRRPIPSERMQAERAREQERQRREQGRAE